MPYENLIKHFASGIDFIKSCIKQGGSVLVHWYIIFLKLHIATLEYQEVHQL